MKAIHLPSVKPLKSSKFWLLGIAAGLIAIQLSITWQSENTNFWAISIVYWVAICSLVWEKRNTLSLKSGVISSFLGTLLIALVLLKTTSLGKFIYVSPLISAVGLGLIASGFKGLQQYWRELLSLFFLGVPHITVSGLIDISVFTAKFAAFVLWYLGFEVSRRGVNINLNTGSVEVYPGCSGMEIILYLWGLAVLFLVMFPTDSRQKIILPVVAVLVGFVVNGVRVCLMAILVASSNHKAFDYWHKGEGSLIFSMVSVLIFGLFCLFLLRSDEAENQNNI